MTRNEKELSHSDYTVGWICALPETELVTAGAMLDEEHPVLQASDPNDANSYLLGRIGDHNVVIACLPAEQTGKVSAATVAKDMVRSFPAIRVGLTVGIGGGAPYYGPQIEDTCDGSDAEFESDDSDDSDTIQDIRLGDVVISLHSKSSEAVVQYDFGKSVQTQDFVRAGGHLNKPPGIVLNAISMLKGQHVRKGHKICEVLSKMLTDNPRLEKGFCHPGSARDYLFKPGISHKEGKKCASCHGPDNTNLIKRPRRSSDEPQIHYGTIGSADQLMNDALLRDKWSRKENIKCFETEAAGNLIQFEHGICISSHLDIPSRSYGHVSMSCDQRHLPLCRFAQLQYLAAIRRFCRSCVCEGAFASHPRTRSPLLAPG
jgi:nucleoside phosphorylase